MGFDYDQLYDMLAKKIREIYKNSDEEITYNREYGYYNNSEKVTVALSECQNTNLRYLLNYDLINLCDLSLQLNKHEQKLYNAYIDIAKLNLELACNLFDYKLYINNKDKQILRTCIINNWQPHNARLILRKSLIERLELTTDEFNKILLYSLSDEYYCDDILITFYDKLTDIHKKFMLENLLISNYAAERCIINTKFPLDFRLQIFQFIYKDHFDSYYNLFTLFYNSDIKDIIRNILFKYIYENTDDFSFWENKLSRLDSSELELICNKFYNDIFNKTSSFTKFYSYCLTFNKWLHKSERLLLIQKLKAKTRASKIAYVKSHILFEPDELDILNSIDLRNKLL